MQEQPAQPSNGKVREGGESPLPLEDGGSSREELLESDGDGLRAKKKVNICAEGGEGGEGGEEAERGGLTMTGTIKRGKRAGQSLDVRLNISREELELLEVGMVAAKARGWSCGCGWGLRSGPHILLLSVLCFPVALLLSTVYAFYLGTLTWSNVFTYVSDEDAALWTKLLLPPLLLLTYPFAIVAASLGLGLYAACAQLSCHLPSWTKAFFDLEKGFYGWLCSALGLDHCAPYQVVLLTDIKGSQPPPPPKTTLD